MLKAMLKSILCQGTFDHYVHFFSRNVHNFLEAFLYIYHNKISHYECTEFITISHTEEFFIMLFHSIQVYLNNVEILLKTMLKTMLKTTLKSFKNRNTSGNYIHFLSRILHNFLEQFI